MLPVRRSPDTDSNEAFVEDNDPSAETRPPAPAQTNWEWIEESRSKKRTFCGAGDVVLLGGKGLADFRVRVAQSHARDDLTPSYWSLVGVVDVDRESMLTAPLSPLRSPELVPITNGIQILSLRDFNDPNRWPNIGIVRFPGVQGQPVEWIKQVAGRRPLVDIPSLVLAWLGFAWGASSTGNPLLDGLGVPSAVLVETAFGMAEVELTPGLAAASSCPEAIYQAAKWWTGYYQKKTGTGRGNARRPVGRYLVRERAASYIEPEPDPRLKPKPEAEMKRAEARA
jgi:hypothetical protein